MIADDEDWIRSSLEEHLAAEGYDCDSVADGQTAFDKLQAESYALVLSDIKMPGLTGIDLLKSIKPLSPDTEFIMMTGYADLASGIGAMRLGAFDYITKPFKLEEIGLTIEGALEKRKLRLENRYYQQNLETEVRARTRELVDRNQQLQTLFLNLIRTLALTLEAKDPYTQGHSARVAEIAIRIAKQLDLNQTEIDDIELAGQLHDIGKLGVREAVLGKPDRLTDDEYEHVKSHPALGERILKPIGELHHILGYIRHHHERFTGGGYPDGLSGDSIPLGARILTVSDAYDAMISSRPYREARSQEYALKEILSQKGRQFDPHVVDTFLEIIAP